MPTLEERVRILEEKVECLSQREEAAEPAAPWWELWLGAFENDPDFDAATEAGAAYRRSQPNAADSPDAITF